VPETVRFKYRAFLSYSHPDTRSTDMTGLQAELEAAFRKLPIAPPDDGKIPYELLIPGIGRQLALMKPVDHVVASRDATKRKLGALKKHAKMLCEDRSAMALLPLKLRISIVEIAHAEDPKLPPPAGRGAPQKVWQCRLRGLWRNTFMAWRTQGWPASRRREAAKPMVYFSSF
jgi:hypothetical protein